MKSDQKYPSIFQQGKNLFNFSARMVEKIHDRIFYGDQQEMMVSPEIYSQRIEICKNCPKFDSKRKKCTECGCYIPVKAKFDFSDCPLFKWEEYFNFNEEN